MSAALRRTSRSRWTCRLSLRIAVWVLGILSISMPALAVNRGLLPLHPRVADAQLLVPEQRVVVSQPQPLVDADVASVVPEVASVSEPEAHGTARIGAASGIPAMQVSASAPTPVVPPETLPFDSLVRRAAEVASVDAALLHAIIDVESGYDPQALSGKGAIGLMQVLPRTGERFGVRRLEDPAENVRAGASYVRWLLSRFDGDLPLVLAAYNAGEGAVLRHGRQIPPFPETQNYVRKVMAGYSRLRATDAPDAPDAFTPTHSAATPVRSALRPSTHPPTRPSIQDIAATLQPPADPVPEPKAARAERVDRVERTERADRSAKAGKEDEVTSDHAWRLLRGLGTLLTRSPSVEATGGRGRDQPAVLMP